MWTRPGLCSFWCQLGKLGDWNQMKVCSLTSLTGTLAGAVGQNAPTAAAPCGLTCLVTHDAETDFKKECPRRQLSRVCSTFSNLAWKSHSITGAIFHHRKTNMKASSCSTGEETVSLFFYGTSVDVFKTTMALPLWATHYLYFFNMKNTPSLPNVFPKVYNMGFMLEIQEIIHFLRSK